MKIDQILEKKLKKLPRDEKEAIIQALSNGSNVAVVGIDRINSAGQMVLHKYICRHPYLNPLSKLVFSVINYYCFIGESNKCFPSQETLSKETGSPIRSVQRALKQLEGISYTNANNEPIKEVFIKIYRQGLKQPNIYIIFYKNVRKSSY